MRLEEAARQSAKVMQMSWVHLRPEAPFPVSNHAAALPTNKVVSPIPYQPSAPAPPACTPIPHTAMSRRCPVFHAAYGFDDIGSFVVRIKVDGINFVLAPQTPLQRPTLNLLGGRLAA